MEPVAVRFDEETRFKLHLLARMTARSRGELVAEAVRRFVDAEIATLIAKGVLRTEDTSDAEAKRALPADGWNIVV